METRPNSNRLVGSVAFSFGPRGDSICLRYADISVGFVIAPTHGIVVCSTISIYEEAFINAPVILLFARAKCYEKEEEEGYFFHGCSLSCFISQDTRCKSAIIDQSLRPLIFLKRLNRAKAMAPTSKPTINSPKIAGIKSTWSCTKWML